VDSPVPPHFAIVVAADEQRGIGAAGGLPWPRLPADLAYFRRVTSTTEDGAGQNAVIMGRRTWFSIPARYQPLPGRVNVVVSRATPAWPVGVLGAVSLDEALATAQAAGARALFVIGGGQLYADAVRRPGCAEIHYTRIAGRFACDTFFPAFEDRFVRVSTTPAPRDAEIDYAFERWVPREPSP